MRAAALALVAVLGAGCGERAPAPLEGRPGGPYRATLATAPAPPPAGVPVTLTTRLSHAASDAPLEQLQVVHERVVHNFIVNLDFSSFAHVHHEDFRALEPAALAAATFSFPYTFPAAGHYRVVSEFTHRDRGWTKHFDLVVGRPAGPPTIAIDLARAHDVGPYHATLHVSPQVPVAGFETELVLELSRDGAPVTDLALLLGSEVHAALWRSDGEHFGHAHSYTPHMAAMLGAMHERSADPATRARRMAAMMAAMIDMPAELVFPGPRVPVRVVFPEPGVYVVFLQCAPAGTPQVFRFMLDVGAYRDGMDTTIESLLAPVSAHGMH